MNIKLMRYTDYFIGVPLCFLLSCFNAISKTICFRPKQGNPAKKIVFLKLSELGAIILSYPLLKKIKEDYASAELFFVTFSRNKDVFELLSGIIPDKNILVIRENSPKFIIFDTFKIITRLRKEKIDIVFDLEFFARFTAIIAYLANANKRIGFHRYSFEGLYRGNLLTHRIQYNPLLHISKNYLSLSRETREKGKSTPELSANISGKEISFPKYVSEKIPAEKMQKKLRVIGIAENTRIFLINPGEGVLPVREWPLENFTALAKLILSNSNNRIIIVGTEKTAQKAEILLNEINSPAKCLSLIGQTDLKELMELFIISNALISNDCGLAHLAMLTSIKEFIIFGPESPHVFGPLNENNHVLYSNWPCSPCLSVLNHRNSFCKDNNCLKIIRPEEVYGLINKSLPINT